MYYPPPWHDVGSRRIDNSKLGPRFELGGIRGFLDNAKNRYRGKKYPAPTSRPVCKRKCSNHMWKGGPNDWFTNKAKIPGEPTLPRDMYDDKYSDKEVERIKTKKTPWNSPGSAPIEGEGCGVNGGNPEGCNAGNTYGSCCKGGCGMYAYGKSAMEHAKEGLFKGATVTTWKRGGEAEVIWATRAAHKGGYAYRLCKVPTYQAEDISKVTEKCFRNGHLSFAGKDTWIMEAGRKAEWKKQRAVRTRNGTTPMDSQWAKIPGLKYHRGPWTFRDYVEVPAKLQPGRYVLSFRWDAEGTRQVWNSCANINIE